MNEHEMLKIICEKIGYKFDTDKYYYSDLCFKHRNYEDKYYTSPCVDVREIIFTPEFMDKYKEYFYNFYKDKYNHIGLNLKWNDFKLGFFNYLDKPVEYLYNIIK